LENSSRSEETMTLFEREEVVLDLGEGFWRGGRSWRVY